jgi:hypothetical protein
MAVMGAPCSRCDCADFKGGRGAQHCLACWHPRDAHHLLVCPECGATIEPVRIPLEAASVGEGWVGRFAEPVDSEQQVLWDGGAPDAAATAGEEAPAAPTAAVEPAGTEDGSLEQGSGAQEGAGEQGPRAEEPPAKNPGRLARFRRGAKPRTMDR